jgi:hypothetical protein
MQSAIQIPWVTKSHTQCKVIPSTHCNNIKIKKKHLSYTFMCHSISFSLHTSVVAIGCQFEFTHVTHTTLKWNVPKGLLLQAATIITKSQDGCSEINSKFLTAAVTFINTTFFYWTTNINESTCPKYTCKTRWHLLPLWCKINYRSAYRNIQDSNLQQYFYILCTLKHNSNQYLW